MEGFEFGQMTLGRGGVASFGTDNALHFVWKMGAVELTNESERAGRKIFADVETCEIHYPGHRDVLIKTFNPKKATNKTELSDFLRMHPKAAALYREWKNESSHSSQGTPVGEWFALSEAERAELRAMNIFTVEQVADASDLTCQTMGPKGREWRTKAQAMIESAKETAAAQRFAAENQRLREDLDLLRTQVTALGVPQVAAVEVATVTPKAAPARKKPAPSKGLEENEGDQ